MPETVCPKSSLTSEIFHLVKGFLCQLSMNVGAGVGWLVFSGRESVSRIEEEGV